MNGLTLVFWIEVGKYEDLLSGKPVIFFHSPLETGEKAVIQVTANLSILNAVFDIETVPYMGSSFNFPTIQLTVI